MLGANDARFGDPLGFRLVQARQVVGGFAPVAFHHHGFPTAVVVDLARPAIVLWATKLGRWTTCKHTTKNTKEDERTTKEQQKNNKRTTKEQQKNNKRTKIEPKAV
jgi:hypothetical protein